MNTEVAISIINSLGFPIAMVCYFAWYNVKREDQHKDEVSKLTEAVNNNTLVMQSLINKLDI